MECLCLLRVKGYREWKVEGVDGVPNLNGPGGADGGFTLGCYQVEVQVEDVVNARNLNGADKLSGRGIMLDS